MSIQSEIERIQANLSDAFAALAEKGVTVPDGSNSNALAGLIAGLEVGGGAAWTSGRIVPSEETATLSIDHGLGSTPTLFIMHLNTGGYSLPHSSSIKYILLEGYAKAELQWANGSRDCSFVMFKNTSGTVNTTRRTNTHSLYSVSNVDDTNISFDSSASEHIFHTTGYLWLAIA